MLRSIFLERSYMFSSTRMKSTSLKSKYVEYHKAFVDTFGDAVWFAAQASGLMGPRDPIVQRDRYTRNSILSAALSIECAANCCLDFLEIPKETREDFYRMRTMAKYDVFLSMVQPGCVLDRTNKFVQPIVELVNIRNSYVHPRVRLIEFDVNEEELRPKGYLAMHSPALDIPKHHRRWKPEHAKKVVTAVCNFYNYFFFFLCPFDDRDINQRYFVKAILSSEVERHIGDDPRFDGRHTLCEFGDEGLYGNVSDKWGLDYSFLGVISFKDGGKTTIRPSDRFRDGHVKINKMS